MGNSCLQAVEALEEEGDEACVQGWEVGDVWDHFLGTYDQASLGGVGDGGGGKVSPGIKYNTIN